MDAEQRKFGVQLILVLQPAVSYLPSFLLVRLQRLASDVEERAVLCHKLLKSDIPTTSVTGSIMGLFLAISHARLEGLKEQQEPSDKIIECLREANLRLPNFHAASIVLASSLYNRYCMAYSNDDYEEGTTILDKVIRAPGPEDRFGLVQPQKVAMLLVTLFAQARSSMFGKPEYLEEAIYRTRMALGDASLERILPPVTKYALAAAAAILQMRRLEDLGTGIGPQEAHPRNLGVSGHPSFQDLTASLTELNAVRPSRDLTTSLNDLNSDNYMKHITALTSINYITDGEELEEAIKYCRLLLAFSHHDSNLTHLATIAGMALRVHLHRAFLFTNKIEYLNEAISVLRDHFNAQGVQRADSSVLFRLIESLSTRYDLLRCGEDYNELMQLFSTVASIERLRTPDWFLISCSWAGLARLSGHSSTLAAYDCAMSLMQDTLTVAPTLDTQHFRLVAIRDGCKSLPLDYASYHLSTGQLARAIETLERGRALIWSEMRGLRTSIARIRAKDSHLADTFASVNKKLEMLTFQLTLSLNSNGDGRDGGSVTMGPFGRLVMKQQELLDDRNKLISQIQELPGFENFLKSPSFDNLYSAAARGPVIIINHCRWRSDILILSHNSPPSLIPTADEFYGRATKLRGRLLGARKKNTWALDSAQYEDALSFVLKELYELVGQPVIKKLNELSVPEQSRVWWCPTSVFCSLPLHAMGPIPSDDGFGPPRYFSDLYIPSYTTTLSTLIESNNSGSHTLGKPSILLVSQPGPTLPGARGEVKAVQGLQTTSTKVTTLISAEATPTTVLKGLRDHRFAHIACHGELEPGKPFDASFKLFGEGRLSLFDIVRSQLPDAEFAFLSACHTAELTEESIADEALHLAAAMQYCGFRSVVGTMWAVVDGDGQGLARNFYKQVFSDRQEGVSYYERTAEALRDAVKILRRKRDVTLERWVNFVHYGA
jgi:tetratricopeptide (TPR) repeat protein